MDIRKSLNLIKTTEMVFSDANDGPRILNFYNVIQEVSAVNTFADRSILFWGASPGKLQVTFED
jgi:hypothetical protein